MCISLFYFFFFPLVKAENISLWAYFILLIGLLYLFFSFHLAKLCQLDFNSNLITKLQSLWRGVVGGAKKKKYSR